MLKVFNIHFKSFYLRKIKIYVREMKFSFIEDINQETNFNEYIYVISNESMPGLVKIGKTQRHPLARISELNLTNVPTPFILEFSLKVQDSTRAEKIVHRVLAKYRVSKDREFFRIKVKDAIKLILSVLDNYEIDYVRSSYGIEKIEKEIKRKKEIERKKRELEKLRKKQEYLKLKKDLEDRLKQLNYELTLKKEELKKLGPEPKLKELPFICQLLEICFFPLPLGWMFWLGILQIFDSKNSTTGVVCLILVLLGYIFYKIDEKNRKEYEIAFRPFALIHSKINKINNEISEISNKLKEIDKKIQDLDKN